MHNIRTINVITIQVGTRHRKKNVKFKITHVNGKSYYLKACGQQRQCRKIINMSNFI